MRKTIEAPRFPTIFIILLLLPIPLLVYGTFWSGMAINDISGPTLMSVDPSENIYIIENGRLIISDPTGNLLHAYPLDSTYGIKEPLTDIYATKEGNVIFGLRASNELREFVQQGGTPLIYKITPALNMLEDYGAYFHFSMLERDGTIYLTDSRDGSLKIYDSLGKQIRSIRTPSGNPPSQTQVSGEEIVTLKQLYQNVTNQMPNLGKRMDASFPFNWPNTVTIHGSELYVADTNNFRIIRMDLGGQLQSIVQITPANNKYFGRITSFAVYGDRIFALFKNTLLAGGALMSIDTVEGKQQQFNFGNDQNSSFDPSDVVATSSRVLVSDPDAYAIYEFTHAGSYVGLFGAESLKDELNKPRLMIHALKVTRYGSIALILVILVALGFINNGYKRKQKEYHDKMAG